MRIYNPGPQDRKSQNVWFWPLTWLWLHMYVATILSLFSCFGCVFWRAFKCCLADSLRPKGSRDSRGRDKTSTEAPEGAPTCEAVSDYVAASHCILRHTMSTAQLNQQEFIRRGSAPDARCFYNLFALLLNNHSVWKQIYLPCRSSCCFNRLFHPVTLVGKEKYKNR